MMLANGIIVWFCFVDVLHFSNALIDFNYWKEKTYCRYKECCSSTYVKNDINELKGFLKNHLYGQHIVEEILVNAIGAHFKNIESSRKPLVMSFHGTSGTGKNFVADFVSRSLYTEGVRSKFAHKITADLMISDQLFTNQLMLVTQIKQAIKDCPYSLFIFDEIEKMNPGIFDGIENLLDHHSSQKDYDFSKAIFIFLSNSAGNEIAKKLKSITDSGRFRDQTTLRDFERIAEMGAYNVQGGLYRSIAIESHVIDHFVPFLPLEPRHVEMCIKTEFKNICKHMDITEKNINDILQQAMTYDETGVYSNNGCKRLSKKVEAYCYKDEL